MARRMLRCLLCRRPRVELSMARGMAMDQVRFWSCMVLLAAWLGVARIGLNLMSDIQFAIYWCDGVRMRA